MTFLLPPGIRGLKIDEEFDFFIFTVFQHPASNNLTWKISLLLIFPFLETEKRDKKIWMTEANVSWRSLKLSLILMNHCKKMLHIFHKNSIGSFKEYNIFTKGDSVLGISTADNIYSGNVFLTSLMTIFWRVIKTAFKLIQIKYVRLLNSLVLEGLN